MKELTSNSHNKQNANTNNTNMNNSINIREYTTAIISFILLIIGITFDYFNVSFFKDWLRLVWYLAAYFPVGYPVIKEAFKNLKKGVKIKQIEFDKIRLEYFTKKQYFKFQTILILSLFHSF